MRILITTGIYPPAIGGPSQYAKNLKENLEKKGHEVDIKTYKLENFLPTGIRHLYFFLKIIPSLSRSDFCIALDTMSVGFPTILASKFLRKKVVVRIGGDFLWEQYVERTGKKVLLREFYDKEISNLSLKERIILKLTRWSVANSSALVFNTEWQVGIWKEPYHLLNSKIFIIENFFGQKLSSDSFQKKNFVGGVRNLKWKNLDTLKKAFSEVQKNNKELILDLENLPYKDFIEKLKSCYAVILVSLGDISPNIISDAIRLGKPFILTKENGIYERVRDVGIFVDPRNEREIAEKILFLSDPENYENQKRKVENFSFSHSWEEISDEFLNIYGKLPRY